MKRLSLLLLLGTLSASAQVEILNQLIPAGGSWTVPEGRVALVSHAATTGGGSFNVDVKAFLPDVGSNDFVRLTTTVDLNFSPRTANPIPFVSGVRFENPSTTTAVVIFGRLASPSDLFACIDSKIDEVTVENGELMAKIVPESKRPAKVMITESDDLLEFEQAQVAQITKNEEGSFALTMPVDDPKKFVQAKVRARP